MLAIITWLEKQKTFQGHFQPLQETVHPETQSSLGLECLSCLVTLFMAVFPGLSSTVLKGRTKRTVPNNSSKIEKMPTKNSKSN